MGNGYHYPKTCLIDNTHFIFLNQMAGIGWVVLNEDPSKILFGAHLRSYIFMIALIQMPVI